MESPSVDLPGQDIGAPGHQGRATPSFDRGEPPNWRLLGLVVVSFALLVGVFVLGQATGQPAETPAAAVPVTESRPETEPAPATAVPTLAPPTPAPTPVLVDLLGEGTVLAEIDFGNRSWAALWCRETVPGTRIGSTLSLLYFADSIRFGEQLIHYEELTRPWIPSGGRRGVVLETEGLGAGDFPGNPDEDGPETATDGISDGSRCEACAPQQVRLDDTDALVGSCVNGVPLGSGIVYAIMAPRWPGQTPLALHASCGITNVRATGHGLVIDAEAPLLRGLHDARFPLPSMVLHRRGGWFEAEDLELLDWYCDVERSSHLQGRHLLRTEPVPRIGYTTVETAIGEIGVHGPLAIGLEADQCSAMTRAWWGRPGPEVGTGTSIAELLGIDPPDGHEDWHYTCQAR